METISFGGLELRFKRDKHETGGSLDMFEMTAQPKAAMPVAHFHENWDETVYGLAGVTTMRIDGADVPVGPGDVAFIHRGVIHGFRNDSHEPATTLCVLTPGVLGPEYFREMANLVSAGKPDPAELKAVMLRHGLVPAPEV